jgi:hypothetical protein
MYRCYAAKILQKLVHLVLYRVLRIKLNWCVKHKLLLAQSILHSQILITAFPN